MDEYDAIRCERDSANALLAETVAAAENMRVVLMGDIEALTAERDSLRAMIEIERRNEESSEDKKVTRTVSTWTKEQTDGNGTNTQHDI